ncbi:MAG: hypothetical protein A2096_12780 [Spirochaetes bacterium GWF1_41_5]|nr:MAG: hypothetical protein A2096_12780 [Spirochaetes bacterium GWF1_41_5]
MPYKPVIFDLKSMFSVLFFLAVSVFLHSQTIADFEKPEDIKTWSLTGISNAKIELTQDKTEKKTGQFSLRIDLNTPEKVNFCHVVKHFPAKPDTSYVLTGWMKTELSSGEMTLEVQDSRGWKQFAAGGTYVKENSDWTKISIKFKTKPDTDKIKIMMRRIQTTDREKAIIGKIWIDDIILTEENIK